MQADPSGETWVDVRQARQREELAYADMIAQERIIDVKGVTRWVGGVTIPEMTVVECWLTFEGCNIMFKPKEDSKTAVPLFAPEMKDDYEAFRKAFGELPASVANEWREEVWAVNPDWALQPSPTMASGDDEEKTSEEPSEST
jgi:hypothetical protein